MFHLNDKTIFVLDHTQYFSISSEDYITIDFLKGKSGESTPSGGGPQFSKSLWTCAVETTVEYCRIVWDLHKADKLVRFLISDTAAHIVNTWNVSTQNITHVMNAMALVGAPLRNVNQSSDFSVIHGLRAAVEALSEPTEAQAMVMAELESKQATDKSIPDTVANMGRVICITSARDNSSMESLEGIFNTVLIQQNVLAAQQKKLLPIDHCHLVIINVVPLNTESLVTDRQKVEISPNLSTEVHTVSAPNISNKLTHLIMSHYDLTSTTVTGIPMKEEQNANSSANYDVEILHSRSAHTANCGNETLLPTSLKEGAEYETVTLKWCTPRGSSSDMQPCLVQCPVTPVDVTSRPSACLINFLLSGRSVLLEMPRKSGGKQTSHLLSARGGEIYIHALQITRSCLEDPPAISEGPGGRVSDYRIADFALYMKAHRFVPMRSLKAKDEDNLQKARERLFRRSRYFPLTFSTSIVFNLQRNVTWLHEFLRRIMKEDMDKGDETHCQQIIYDLYHNAKRCDVLPFTNMAAGRIKGNKKHDQYKLLLAELELLVRSCSMTVHHKVILEHIQNARAACGDTSVKIDSDTNRDPSGKSIIRATTDSPLSPPHSMDSSSSAAGSSSKSNKSRSTPNGQKTLYDLLSAAERSQSGKRLDFSGRLCTPAGQVAKLYPEFGTKDKEVAGATTTLKEENGIKL